MRRIYGPKRGEMVVEWRRLHNKELHNLYPSSNIITVIKSRRMRWAGHVARMEEMKNFYIILVGKPERNPCYVGLCNHSMARPQVADGGKASRYGG
jgi:hypothetical protein